MTTSQQPPAAASQDPLSALEELLKKQQAQQSGGEGVENLAEAAGPTPEEVAAQELEKRQAEFEVLQKQRQITDQQQLKEQIAALSQIADTPQEHARQQQNQDVVDERASHAQDETGFQIKQIEHKKI